MNQLSKPPARVEPIRLSEEPDFVLGGIEVRPSLREVRRGATKEQLEPRIMQVLVALARSDGAVVSRDELIQSCWEGRIVGEAAINRCIWKLRELSVAGGEPTFHIQTIPRVGYRIARVNEMASTGAASSAVEARSDPDEPNRAGFTVRALMLGAVVVLAAALISYELWVHSSPPLRVPSLSAASEPSIAVLPFKNLSSDKDAGYLAAGVQDEILTRLAKIGSLKVISRTSADQFAISSGNIPEIAKRLGVANVLEGSVQRAGNAVRINVQLIRAATDDHLWAEDYDRRMDNVFSVESEVAGAIAVALAAKVTPGERNEITAQPTTDSRAYDLYLRGLVLSRKNETGRLTSAVDLFQQAVAADPRFTVAWALLSRTDSYLYFDDGTAQRRESARLALARAVDLQPELAEVRLADGFFKYYVERDFAGARHVFENLHARSPNNVDALLALGLIARRQGRWEESKTYLSEVVTLDPLTPDNYRILSTLLGILHEYPAQLRVIDAALGIWPDSSEMLMEKVDTYQLTGQLDLADAVLANLHPARNDLDMIWGARCGQFIYRRQYREGIRFFDEWIANERPLPTAISAGGMICLGELHRLAGNLDKSKVIYNNALTDLLAALKRQPDNPGILRRLAYVSSGLGDGKMAPYYADRAVQLVPLSRDPMDGFDAEELRAHVEARLADREKAIPAIARLLKLPGHLTPTVLRLDPDFDSLRGDPRFESLLKTDNRQ